MQRLRAQTLRVSAAVLLFAASACTMGKSSLPPPDSGITPDNHIWFPILDGGSHALDCVLCHPNSSDYKQYDCLSCHAHDNSATNLIHKSVTSCPPGVCTSDAGYSYLSSACLGCHPTGTEIAYDHAGIAGNCAYCHDVGGPIADLPFPGFTHPGMGGKDCGGCHTTASWLGAGAPDGGVFDPAQNVTVNAFIPLYSGTSIASLSPQTELLHMSMNHLATQVPVSTIACGGCHPSAAVGGAYFPGLMHYALNNLGLPQPTGCTDCHAPDMPVGFVGTVDAVRNPQGPQMKHDAVVWTNNLPTPTPVVAIATECGVCHTPPDQYTTAATGWTRSTFLQTDGGPTAPAIFHASLTQAGKAQPASCLDCHANSRPSVGSTNWPTGSVTLTTGSTFDHTVPAAMGDCATCHAASAPAYTTWVGGTAHASGSANPTTCIPCHSAERPSATVNPTSTWKSTTFNAACFSSGNCAQFDYTTNTAGIPHGNGLDCATCHPGPGTGAWGGTQNWVGGSFPHGVSSAAGQTCVACHSTQRPNLSTPVFTPANLGGFDHSLNGTGDCFGCHQATVTRGAYAVFKNPAATTTPFGDWSGGQAYPGSTLVSGSDQFITETEFKLNATPPALVTSMSSSPVTIYNQFLHTSTTLPPGLSNTGNTGDNATCWHCHTNTAGAGCTPATGGANCVTAFANGKFHNSLTNYCATPPATGCTPLAQPTTCNDCHGNMRPANIVEKGGNTDNQAMDHSSALAQVECGTCHVAPTTTPGAAWTDGVFHAKIGASVPTNCTVCHYPLMSDAAKSDVASSPVNNYQMKHASLQLTFQDCKTCHTAALGQVAGSATPTLTTLFRTGSFHGSLLTQPSSCIDCHAVSQPGQTGVANPTQSTTAYTFSGGGNTATNTAQWMNHSSIQVAGKDCVTCHRTDAKTSGSAWSKADTFHGPVAAPTTCQECHGLANGNGSVPGTNNNMPAGLSNSSTITTAEASTGTSGLHDQISHSEINVTSHDCVFCHITPSNPPLGTEWSKASFHANFTGPNPLNITTGKCNDCHYNIVPKSTFTTFDHTPYQPPSATTDCSSCHGYPGTGVPGSTTNPPNWLGASFLHKGFPINTPNHPGNCNGCHDANKAKTDLTGLMCATCHLLQDPSLITHHTTTTSKSGFGLDTTEIVATAYNATTGDGSQTCIMCHSDTPGTSSATSPFSLTGLTTPPDAVLISTHSWFSVNHKNATTGCTSICHLANTGTCTSSRCKNLKLPDGGVGNYMRTDKPWAIDFLSPGPCTGTTEVPGCYDCHGKGCRG